MKWLVYGGKGWIGQQIIKAIGEDTVVIGEARADDEVGVEEEIGKVNPDRIVCVVGRTYGPGYNTIDYLEQPGKLVENVRDNLYGPMVLAFMAMKFKIHLTYVGTGCIFNNLEMPDTSFNEEDRPNFFGSSYSTVKGFTDRLMHLMEPYVLNCRIRMPINAEVHNRNFITKIMNYPKICSIQNSMTVLPELLPIMIDMARHEITGTINLTNPGTIEHNEILEMVKEYINPNITWQNFSIEEQALILKAGRSNNKLDTTKLETMYPNVTPIKEAVKKIIIEMSQLNN